MNPYVCEEMRGQTHAYTHIHTHTHTHTHTTPTQGRVTPTVTATMALPQCRDTDVTERKPHNADVTSIEERRR